MLLWFIFALMTAGALALVLAPLGRGGAVAAASGADQQVYRDQLTELEADKARGLIGEAEYAEARIEISRRLLAAAGPAGVAPATAAADTPAGSMPSGTGNGAFAKGVILVAAVAVPLVAAATYRYYGAPHLPARPHAERAQAPPGKADILDLVARVEERLRTHPEEGDGWDAIAPVYLRMERFQDAVDAYRNAIRLKGQSVARLLGLGEALIVVNNGVVTDEARSTYERVLQLAPGRMEAQFWLTLAREQDGKLEEAVAGYQKLLAEGDPAAPWRAAVTERLNDVLKRLGRPPVPPAAKGPVGPSAEDMAAAAKMTPAQRTEMINQMVAGLAEKLKADGRDLEGWLRLIRAYAVLERREEARNALAEARRRLTGDKTAEQELDKLAAALGLKS